MYQIDNTDGSKDTIISISKGVTNIFTNWKRIFTVGMACLLALLLAGCYEYRGPYTKADVEEYLTGRYQGFRHGTVGLTDCQMRFSMSG